MASEHIYDVVKVDRVEGREKPFYSNVGKVIRTDKGYMKLHLPVLGWFDLFEPRPREDRETHPQHTKAPVKDCPQPDQGNFEDDDIPF